MKNTILIILSLLFIAACGSKSRNEEKKASSIAENTPPPASAPASTLLEKIRTIPEKGFMIGHQDAPSYGIGWTAGETMDSDVKRVCGDYPAVFGWDIGWLESGKEKNLDDVPFDFMRKTIVQVHEMGGINTISWHSDNPVTGESTWSEKETIKYIFDGGENQEKFDGWLQKLAAFFHSLETVDGKKVPVVFRPYHEHDGSWFWWGEDHCTPEEYRKLWIYTHEALTDKHGIDNLLWAYSPNNFTTRDEYLNKYPGDQYVDILGFDLYRQDYNKLTYAKTVASNFTILDKLSEEKQKPYAFTETGFESIPEEDWFESVIYPLMKESRASWVLFWRNHNTKHHYAPYPGHPAADNFRKFCNMEGVLLLGEL